MVIWYWHKPAQLARKLYRKSLLHCFFSIFLSHLSISQLHFLHLQPRQKETLRALTRNQKDNLFIVWQSGQIRSCRIFNKPLHFGHFLGRIKQSFIVQISSGDLIQPHSVHSCGNPIFSEFVGLFRYLLILLRILYSLFASNSSFVSVFNHAKISFPHQMWIPNKKCNIASTTTTFINAGLYFLKRHKKT